MACPFFKPSHPVVTPRWVNGRLPLIDEYEGHCLAVLNDDAPAGMRLDGCNRGYSRGVCEHFPASEQRSAFRYTVVRHTADALEVLCIEEQDHAPGRHYQLCYTINEARLAPDTVDEAVQAQALAFCRSYLTHFALS
jgi:hypothetical protein